MASGFVAFAEELLQPFGRVARRRMFGGHGVYLNDLFVAIIWKDTLFLKATGDGAAACEAAGLKRFRPGARYALGFYAPPEEALENPDALRPWVETALLAARQKAAKSGPKTIRRQARE